LQYGAIGDDTGPKERPLGDRVQTANELWRAARVALNIGQRELAKLSGVGQRTILRIERNDETVTIETRRRLQDFFEKESIIFTPGDGVSGPGMRIRRDRIQQGN
jgi:transcriptional regulator with XRE-family HTH domain